MIKNLKVKPGCISCRICENLCPKAFKVDPTSEVQEGWKDADQDAILEAEKQCPVNVIQAEIAGEENNSSNSTNEIKKYLQCKISENEIISQDTRRIGVKIENFNFKKGQFANLTFGEFTRAYSILEGDDKNVYFAIKINKGSESLKKVSEFEIGDKVDVSQAVGHFVIQKNKNKKVFIGTGTGVAPLFAMAQEDEKSEKVFIAGYRYENESFYEEELNKIKNLKLTVTISKPSDKWEGEKGRVTSHLDNIKKTDEIYICGNGEMIRSVKKILKDRNHPDELIFNESFGDSKKPEENTGENIEEGKKENKEEVLEKKVEKTSDIKTSDVKTYSNTMYFKIFKYILLLFGLFIPYIYFFPEAFGVSKYLLWDISWYSLFILMLIRPLSDLFPNNSFLKALIPLRKELGIISAIVVFAAILEKFLLKPDMFFQAYFSIENFLGSINTLFARISEITGILLLLTSNTISQEILKTNWKKIQLLSYPYFISAGIYLSLIGKDYAIYLTIFVLILNLLAFIKNRK